MTEKKLGWDTRAWWVGVVGGLVGGNVTAWFGYPPVAHRLNFVPHLYFSGAAHAISGIAGLLSLLVLPGVLSGIARRRSFFWGLLPLALFLPIVECEDWLENGAGHAARHFWLAVLVLGICLIVSSGPVSLFRYTRARARRRREAAATSIPREGVWPPPPEYRQ